MAGNELHSGHRERLRQRMMTYGADALCDHELLELILFYALPRVNTNDIAHILLNRFGTLNNVLNASAAELRTVSGIGSSAAEFIRLIADLCGEYESFSPDSEKLTDTDSLCSFFLDYFGNSAEGLCLLVSLNDCLEVTGRISFTSDSLMSGNAEMKRIAGSLLRNGSGRIALGIAHSTRKPVPDERDFAIARLLAERLGPIGISLEDCIICGAGRAFSMKRSGAFSFGR